MLRAFSIAALALSCLATTAGAQPVMAPDEDFARRAFAQGVDAYAHNDYEAALKQFLAARQASGLPGFDYNIGRCLDRLGRWSEAADAYQHFVDAQPQADNAAELRARILELRQRVERATGTQRRSVLAPAILAGGVGLVAATGAILYGTAYADYQSRQSQCHTQCAPDSLDGLRSEIRTRQIVSGVLWGVAGIALVADVALWALRARHNARLTLHGEGLGVQF